MLQVPFLLTTAPANRHSAALADEWPCAVCGYPEKLVLMHKVAEQKWTHYLHKHVVRNLFCSFFQLLPQRFVLFQNTEHIDIFGPKPFHLQNLLVSLSIPVQHKNHNGVTS
jgi:hypothetical protein